jgi:uncharacterized Zn-finger protein
MVVQHCMSFMKMDPGADSGTYLKYSYNTNELPDIKKEEEQNPLLMTFPVMKVEVKDDLNLTCKEIDVDTEENVASSWPENELCDVKDGDLLLTCPLLAENKRELQDLGTMKDVLKEKGNAGDDTVREDSGSSLTDFKAPCTARKDVPSIADICNNGISQSELVMEHTRRLFTGNDLDSQNSKNGYSGKGDISKHQRISCTENSFKYDNGKSRNVFKCDSCSKMFTHKHNLVVHQRIHTQNRPFVCDFCGKRFTVSGKCLRHRRMHTGEKCFECDTCGKRFSEKFGLKRHIRIHSGEKLFICETCGKAFSDRSNFLVHNSRYHGDEEPFKCDVCGVSVREHGSLERHRRKHSGENPFICDICGKHFFDKRDIVKHLKTHMSERPFVCVICGKGFLEKRKLVRHQRTNFCRKPLKCDICGKLFSSRVSIQKHIRTHC